MKTLAIQFKYLGDAVFLTPALRAMRAADPKGELHVLLAAEVAPLLAPLPWINRVWSLPRTRGRARLRDAWPVIRALRQARFDRVVDFGGNDRGAIFSSLTGARVRLGAVDRFRWLQKVGYTQAVATSGLSPVWVQRHLELLQSWQIPPPADARMEIVADPALAGAAAALLPEGRVLCHLGTSQPCKEWPVARWQEFYRLATAAGFALAFSAGTNAREQTLLAELKRRDPAVFALPPIPGLPLFLAVLQRARAVVAGDTGPLHFAAGLGLPVLGLYGMAASVLRTAPIYPARHVIQNDQIFDDFPPDDPAWSCLADLPAERVLTGLNQLLAPPPSILSGPRP